MSSFDSLDLIEPLLRAVAAERYATPTPIQAQAIPPLLAGRDVLGCARTGTGKTAAFLLPVLQHLTAAPRRGRRPVRALVLTPTRELAAQIAESCAAYGQFLDLRHQVIFGGVSQRPQVAALRRGVDILVATPGRLLDLHGQGHLDLSEVSFFVLDEADRMLDMGFIHDIRRVLRLLPERRQNLLFSATMPESIVSLAGGFLSDPVRVEVTPQASTAERVRQQVMFVTRADKKRLLQALLRKPEVESAIVFTRTKHGANRVAKQLLKAGVEAAAIHGNKSQNARTRALAGFKSGEVRVLVATDIAARGIDVDGVSHVFNYDLPNISESYVHRIGRTARAGRGGVAIAFCDETEGAYLRDIEALTGEAIEVVSDHQWHAPEAVPAPARGSRGGSRSSRGGSRGSRSSRGGSRSSRGGGGGSRPVGARPHRAQAAPPSDGGSPGGEVASRPRRRRSRRKGERQEG